MTYPRYLVLILFLVLPSWASAQEGSAFELSDGDRVVFLGDGFFERDLHDAYLETMLTRRFPGRKLVFRNLGWTGDSTTRRMRPLSFGDLEHHVTHQRPSLLFVNYGMNDSFEGPGGLDAFRKGYSDLLDLVRRKVLRSPSAPKIILISPIRHENLGPPLPDPTRHNEDLKLYVEAAAQLARFNRFRFINLFDGLGDGSQADPPHPFTESGIHLSPYGYWRAAAEIEKGLGLEAPVWTVQLNAGNKTIEVQGAEVKLLEVAPERVRFEVTDAVLPPPPPPQGSPSESRLPGYPRRLQVAGLDPGHYRLLIGGQQVAAASAQEWERGVDLKAGPEFGQTEQLRRRIVQKNMLFFLRWRPYNTEYIYGRRSEARGANVGNPQFAQEMERLDQMIEEAETEIDQLSVPVTHVYELAAGQDNAQTAQ